MLAEAAAFRAAARVDLARAAQAMAADKIYSTPRDERMRIRESPASALRDEIEAFMRAKGDDAALLDRVSRALSEHDSTDRGSSSSSSILSSIPHRDDSDRSRI
jgi:acyl-CoA reductase-like NAD-dependent aldehyde dehydrogenase